MAQLTKTSALYSIRIPRKYFAQLERIAASSSHANYRDLTVEAIKQAIDNGELQRIARKNKAAKS